MNIPESNIRNMLKAISGGNHVLNEIIRLYKSTNSECPNCEYDPIRKESIDIHCQTCGGTGSITTTTYQEIPSSVETFGELKYEFKQVGSLIKGQISCTLDIKEINEVLNLTNQFDLSEYSGIKKFVEQYDYITWKNAKYTLDSFEAGYLQGNLYEIALVLQLTE